MTHAAPAREAPRVRGTLELVTAALPAPIRDHLGAIGVAAVMLVAALTRLVGLGTPGQIMFDETYYVKDAWTLLQLGYESSWSDANGDPDALFAEGDPSNYTGNGSFVVHPPLGKWIIALGLAVLGPANPVGWRIGIALCGIALVAVVMGMARLLFRAMPLVVLAGLLVAIDGNAIALSRIGILDTALALFIALGALFVLLDRRWSQARTALWMRRRRDAGRPTDWGPVLWNRPWLLAAAAAFGCASAVKWSGIYALAVFAVYAVLADVVARRRLGIPFWLSGSLLRQGPASFLLTVPLAAAIHLASWTGWFVTDGGYDRQWAAQYDTPGTGPFGWLPPAVRSWWHDQESIYAYHVSEHTPHPYQANPLTWLLLVRPTSMYYQGYSDGSAASLLDIANPLIWWSGTAALVACVVLVVRGMLRRERVWREAFILVGMPAAYLPWLLYLDRTVFQFYTIAFEAFLVLAIVACARRLVGSERDALGISRAGLRFVLGWLALVVVISLFFLPLWTGVPTPVWFQRLHYWFPTWV